MSQAEQNGQASSSPAAEPSLPADRRRRSSWIWLVVGSAILLVALVAVVRTVAVRRIPELTDAALDVALERWEANGPDSYRLEVEIEGLRPGTVTVEVRQREVVKMTRDGQTPSQRRTWSVWSVTGMFDMIEREMELAEDPAGEMNIAQDTRLWLRCEFDRRYGYPKQFHRAVFGGGPEVYWRVTRFEVL